MEITIGKAGLIAVNGESTTIGILEQIIREYKLDGHVIRNAMGEVVYKSGNKIVKPVPYAYCASLHINDIDRVVVIFSDTLVWMQGLDAEANLKSKSNIKTKPKTKTDPKNAPTKKYQVDLKKGTHTKKRKTDKSVFSVTNTGHKIWTLDNVCHRLDGPALIAANGMKAWYIHGKLHREEGPAVEHPDGRKEWWIDDKLHRTGGPAIENKDGTKDWYSNGKLRRRDYSR